MGSLRNHACLDHESTMAVALVSPRVPIMVVLVQLRVAYGWVHGRSCAEDISSARVSDA